VRAHVRCCDECAAFEADVQWITTSLRRAPLEESPRVVVPRRRRQPIRLRVAVQAASIALVAVGVGSVVLPGGPIVDRTGEESLLASSLMDTVVANESIRELRDDAMRHGEIAVLPELGSDSIGEAKPALPAVPA